ncbi:MurR/RpiR family transcriptional regulator [Clostridium sp. C8-1-8]|uniref:MurR/RpiR family transcriptional regulator n=1 Tax=Clostridium sp. C8-1-8 TaxID=2698831 RepID=UPI00136EB863|nr:MurR/RpiR family transcriptional regulator [Clostridium sp. C8-1-8]
MDPIEKLKFYEDSFTKSESQIMNYIISKPLDIIQLPIIEIAKRSNTSKSAIIRLCQKIGYDGFSEFKFDLSRYLISNNQTADNTESNNTITTITSSYADYINKISETLTIDDVKKLSQYMLSSSKVKIFGINRTGFSANQFRYRLSKIGFDAESITDTVLMQDAASNLKKEDLCIIFSIKGSKEAYLDCVKILKENNCKTTLITMTQNAPIESYFNQVIHLPYISKLSAIKFLDDQAIFFVFIEILLSELASLTKQQ